MSLNESIVEDAALTWFLLRPVRQAQGYGGQVGELGYAGGHGPQLAPGEQAGSSLTPALSQGERESYGEVVQSRFPRTLTLPLPAGEEKREAIRRLNASLFPSRTLATPRDPARAGLPKLLSGELSVAEASS